MSGYSDGAQARYAAIFRKIANAPAWQARHGLTAAQYLLIDGRWKMSIPFWLRVPPNKIIDRTDNPTNRAVVCFTPEAGILCFVRPAES